MSATTPPPHRQSHRKLADRILGIQIEPDNYAIVLNVSDGGMGFRAISPITQSGTIRFSFVENGRAVAASGELVWMDEAKMTGGLSFASVPKSNRERFHKWIDRGETHPEDPPAPEHTVPPETVSHSPSVSATLQNPGRAPQTSPFGGAPTPPVTPQTNPAQGGFALFEDIPRGPGYAWDEAASVPHEHSRFFVGFLAGAIFAAIVAAILFFTYGGSILPARSPAALAAPSIGTNSVPTTAPSTPPDTAPPAAMPSNPDPSSPPSTGSEDAAAPSAPLPTPPEESKGDFQGTGARGTSAPQPATSKEVPTLAAKPNPQTAEPGAEDLAIAERYLNDHPGPSGSATAAGYLWAAVKKGSVEAELTLAELYIRGEGVPKNCGQARVLLSAAAKKGNQTASEELAQLVRNGCR
jgi:hypothetical protein